MLEDDPTAMSQSYPMHPPPLDTMTNMEEEDRETMMQIPGIDTRWDDQAKRLITKLFCVASFKRDIGISMHILNFALIPPSLKFDH